MFSCTAYAQGTVFYNKYFTILTVRKQVFQAQRTIARPAPNLCTRILLPFFRIKKRETGAIPPSLRIFFVMRAYFAAFWRLTSYMPLAKPSDMGKPA